MNELQTDKTEWSLGYAGNLEKRGYEFLIWETFGSYQGDYLAIARKDGKLGVVVIGYGSCPGCDAIEACGYDTEPEDEGYPEYQKAIDFLMDNIERDFFWGTPDEIVAHLDNASAVRWYQKDEDFQSVFSEIRRELALIKRENK